MQTSACVMTMHAVLSPHKKSLMTMLLFQLQTWDNQGHHCYNPVEFNYLFINVFTSKDSTLCFKRQNWEGIGLTGVAKSHLQLLSHQSGLPQLCNLKERDKICGDCQSGIEDRQTVTLAQNG